MEETLGPFHPSMEIGFGISDVGLGAAHRDFGDSGHRADDVGRHEGREVHVINEITLHETILHDVLGGGKESICFLAIGLLKRGHGMAFCFGAFFPIQKVHVMNMDIEAGVFRGGEKPVEHTYGVESSGEHAKDDRLLCFLGHFDGCQSIIIPITWQGGTPCKLIHFWVSRRKIL